MCGCSSFDGETNDLNNELVELNSTESSFERDEDFDNFGGSGYTSFVDDFETDEFDNFLTKKMRARRQRKKELQEGGLSRSEARKKALEEIPRDKLKQVIANLKAGKEGGAGLGSEIASAVEGANLNDVSTALTNSSTTGGTMSAGMPQNTQAGFFERNKTAIIGVGVVAVLVGGYFAFGKKLGIR